MSGENRPVAGEELHDFLPYAQFLVAVPVLLLGDGVALTLAATGLTYWGAQEWLTGSWQFVERRLTAGWWYLVVGSSVLRFLSLRWAWRLLLWG